MWGQDWGAMIWGTGVAVPVMGPLGWIILGALMGVTAVRVRSPLSRTKLSVALIVGIVVPLAAIAQVTLPNAFSNGTVADADQVNANFEAILGDTARYHLVLDSADPPLAIPAAITDQLCKDHDGCELLLVKVEPGSVGSPAFMAAPTVRMYIDDSGPLDSWIIPATSNPVRSGVDDNGFEEPVLFDPLNECIVSDGVSSGDSAEGFFLFFTGVSPNLECRLTIID